VSLISSPQSLHSTTKCCLQPRWSAANEGRSRGQVLVQPKACVDHASVHDGLRVALGGRHVALQQLRAKADPRQCRQAVGWSPLEAAARKRRSAKVHFCWITQATIRAHHFVHCGYIIWLWYGPKNHERGACVFACPAGLGLSHALNLAQRFAHYLVENVSWQHGCARRPAKSVRLTSGRPSERASKSKRLRNKKCSTSPHCTDQLHASTMRTRTRSLHEGAKAESGAIIKN
jgi:hypothetical protein